MRRRVQTFALLLSLGLVRAANAEEPSAVELTVDPACTRVDRAQLTRLLDIEQQRDPEADVRGARVDVHCSGGLAYLSVLHSASPVARERSFALADVRGEIGARVLALAAIELLKPEPEPETEPAEPPPPPSPPPPPPAPPSPLPAPPTVRLLALGSVSSFGFKQTLLGGGLAVDYLRLSRLGVRLGFDVAVADRNSELGRAHVQLATLNAQVGYLAQHDYWSARAFVGYRLGAGRISGVAGADTDARTGTVAAACGGPLLSGALGLRSDNWLAELGAEAGLVSFPIKGMIEDSDSVALDRYWLSINLSVGALL